jgi:hypothetical protein
MSPRLRAPRRVLLAATGLALAAPAPALATDVDTGSTTLTLSATTLRALDGAGITASAILPARGSAGSIRFPIVSGDVRADTGRGFLSHRGGLRLRRGSRSVTLDRPRTDVGTAPTLKVRVGSRTLTVGSIDRSLIRVRRDGIDTTLLRVQVKLTSVAAVALNRALGVRSFRRGLVLGTARQVLDFQQAAIRNGSTDLVPNREVLQLLVSQGYVVSVVSPATNEGTSFRFPVVSGTLDTEAFLGEVRHFGGLQIARGDRKVVLERFNVNLDATPDVSVLVNGQARLSPFDLSSAAGAPAPRIDGRRVTASGLEARLNAAGAAALNQAFETNGFQAGQLIGTLSTSINLR